MIVTIDGPAGSGKSTVAHGLAAQEGFLFLDTGATYRALAVACLERGIDVDDGAAVAEAARSVRIGYESASDGSARVFADGEDVTDRIRTDAVDAAVSHVAKVGAAREAMTELQREVARSRDVVCEGRDMGTVVFPDADVKVYLDASLEARARRRAVQKSGGDTAEDAGATADPALEAEVLKGLTARDETDATRSIAPLAKADDATVIDTTGLSVGEVIAAIDVLIQRRRAEEAQSRKLGEGATAPVGGKGLYRPGPKAAERPRTAYDAKLEPMRPFGNDFEDYFDHGLMDYPLPSRLLYNLIGVGVLCVTKLLWPWRFEDEEGFFARLGRQDRGTVLIMNHISFVETALPSVIFWLHGQRIRPIYKDEVNEHVVFEWVLSRVGGIPVGRGTSDMKALRRAQHAIERGESVLVFPEGTRIQDDAQEAERHGGFALIARMGKTDVTPSAVVGARRHAPGKKLFHRRHVFLKIGDAIAFGMLGVKGRRRQLEAMEERAMEKVYELRDQLRLEHPGEV